MRRLVIAAAIGAAIVGAAAPSLAQSAAPRGTLPVGATVRTDNGVFVGTTIFGQPGAAAAVGNGKACVGFSYQVPQCATLPPVTVTALPREIDLGPVRVSVSTDNGVAVGTALGSQPLVGAWIGNGQACVGFSLEVPFCVPLNMTGKAIAQLS